MNRPNDKTIKSPNYIANSTEFVLWSENMFRRVYMYFKELIQHMQFRGGVMVEHSDYRTVSPYWVLPVYVELIRAVWADDGDRPLLF
jgi:hypothetical protein